MKRLATVTAIIGVLTIVVATQSRAESGRIYGKLYTVDNETFEGWIRWDKNEAYWDDALDGICERDRREVTRSNEPRRYKDMRKKSINIFGLHIGDENIDVNWSSGSSCELQFGNIKTLYIEGSSEAIAELKSGEEVDFTSGGDFGGSVRDILMEDINEGEIYFDWDDVDKIDFMREPTEPDDGHVRLYGVVTTRRAGEIRGWIEWDVDEVFGDDILDGDEDGHRKRKIPFDKIRTIERRSSSSATVYTTDGREMVLRNSNDVNSENRGIYIKSGDFGRIKVDWSDFEKVDFQEAPKSLLPHYDDFDGGHPIKGTVTTEDGDEYSGHIIWDNDEEYSWEHLNGDYKDLSMDVPFSDVAVIEKDSRRGSIVTLKNGDSYTLTGSNDVDDDNRGIFVVRDNGDVEEIDWYDFAKLVIK
jgi:hypothetical protein